MKSPKVVIIDYDVGNLLSVKRAFDYFSISAKITSDQKEIFSSSHVVFPGVGAFGAAMEKIKKKGLIDIINRVSDKGTPLLGICLGMQLIFEKSYEFEENNGLGLISGEVKEIPKTDNSGDKLKIPHIGWNSLNQTNNEKDWSQTVLKENNPGDSFYFVHSYMAIPSSSSNLLASCNYGGHSIPAVVQKENIVGCQFHPEKSGKNGLKILKNFILQKQ